MPATDTSRQLHLIEPDGLAARYKLGNEGVAAPHGVATRIASAVAWTDIATAASAGTSTSM